MAEPLADGGEAHASVDELRRVGMAQSQHNIRDTECKLSFAQRSPGVPSHGQDEARTGSSAALFALASATGEFVLTFYYASVTSLPGGLHEDLRCRLRTRHLRAGREWKAGRADTFSIAGAAVD